MIQEFGVCNLSIIPLRSEPSDKSEITSQLLFGDLFRVVEKIEKWVKIELHLDGYEGWIDNKQYCPLKWDDFELAAEATSVLDTGIYHAITNLATGEKIFALAGSSVPATDNNIFRITNSFYKLDTPAINPFKRNFEQEVGSVAKFYLNSPYLWGGKSLFGIDCSGFTQMVFKQFGIHLKRDAWQQAEQGELISFLPEAEAGDLAFFDNDEGRIIHVGIMLDNFRIIHASGKVRIDSIDDQGIYNLELKRYTHKLRILKRFKG